MQKIKIAASNPVKLKLLYLYLSDFNLNYKLLNFIKQNKYNVYVKDIANVRDEDIIENIVNLLKPVQKIMLISLLYDNGMFKMSRK